MSLVNVEEGQRLLAGLVELQREVQTKVDKRGAGWRVYLETRRLVEVMSAPLPQDDTTLQGFVDRAIPLLRKKMAEMDAADAYNPLSVQLAECSEIDLFLLQKKLADEDHVVRLDAVAAVGELAWEGALPQLLELLEGETHVFVLSKLVKVIGQLGGDRVLETLTPYLSHEDDRVRANTVEGMEAIPGDEKFHRLLPLLEDPVPRVRANALKVVRALGDDRFTQVVRWMMQHPDLGHRQSVLHVLGVMKGDFAHQRLVEMLQDHHPDIRVRVIEMLAARPELASVDALLALLQGECSDLTREHVAGALRKLQQTAPATLQGEVQRHLQEAVQDLGERRGSLPPTPGGDLVAQLDALARAPEPEPEPPPPPPRASTPPESAAPTKKDKDGDFRKVMARMKTTLSALDPRERTQAEKMIRSGRILNETQLKTVVGRLRAKRKKG